MRHALRLQVMEAVLAGALLVPAGVFAQEAQSTPQTPRVDRRENRQQKRVAQGVKSGQLTPKETVKLEREQGKISAMRRAPRAMGPLHRKSAQN